jgi:RHS repeat-associated protein
MGKTSAGKLAGNVAHRGSAHFAPGPPAISGGPGVTPASTFIPGPFMYVARSKTLHANGASGPRTTCKGKKRHRALVLGSYTDIEQPGNMPAKPGEKKPTGADLSNMVIIGISKVCKASGEAYSADKQFAVTTDLLNLCIPGEGAGALHQAEGTLLDAAAPGMSAAEAHKHKPRIKTMGDPVTVATGEVLDEEPEILLPGLIEVEWKRLYGSSRHTDKTPLGRGGWTHNFHQWVEPNRATGGFTLRGDEGGDVEFPPIEARSSFFHRGRRLTLRRAFDEIEVYDHDERLTREFAPLAPGEKAAPLRAVRDAWGARVKLEYGAGGRLAAVFDTAMREIRIRDDAEGRVVRLEVWAPEAIVQGEPGPMTMQQSVDYAYSEDGDLASTRDALGNGCRYRYDGRHRLIERTLPGGVTFRYTYDDARSRCVRSTADQNLQNVELIFDDQERTTIVHGTPEPREFVWNEEGLIVCEKTFDGSFEEITTYDGDGHVLTTTNAGGDVLAFERDEHANITKATLPDGNEVIWEYWDDLIVRRVDPGGRVIACAYDERGGLVREMDWAGRWLAYTLDRYGRTIAIHDATGLFTAFEYDAQHNVVGQTDERGGVYRYHYDTMGRLIEKVDPIGRVTKSAYDVLGRLVREELPDGTIVAYAWDAEGNIVETGDGRGLTDKAVYGGTGSVTRRTMPDGQTWEYVYDILERLREIKNPKGERHRFRYDRAGHRVEETTFDGQVIRYQYSRRGLLSRVEYADDTWLEYTYNALGYVEEEASPHGTRRYARSELGWIVEAVLEEHNASVSAKLAWDIQGRLLEETIDGRTVRYTYDEATGRLASRTLPNGETTRYFFDPAGALIGLDHEGDKVLLQRDILGRELRRYVYRCGVDMRMAYNDDDRLTHLWVTSPALPGEQAPHALVTRAWRYGPHARVSAVNDARWGLSELEHDLAGRLLAAGRGPHREIYEYDAAGSVQAIRGPGSTSTEPWPMRMGNVLLRSDEASYEYDARRRRRRKIHLKDGAPTGEVTEYVWDCRSQLREVILPGGDRVLFTYDPFGRRLRKTVVAPLDPAAPMETPKVRRVDYVWDVNELALEIDSDRGERVFVHEPSTFFPILHREQGETFTYVTDHLGVPTELIDDKGRIAWAGAHSPWGSIVAVYRGEPQATERPVETPFRLLGQYHDDETGLASTRHRLFDPATARWLTPDPLGLEGGPNLFAFDGSPVERVDPLGLKSLKKFQNFLTKTHGPRRDANRAARRAQRGPNGNGLGPRTASSSRPINPNQPKGTTALNKGDGTACGHAERNPMREAQGLPASNTQSGVGALGAGRPHCGGCTQSIIDTPGAVTSSRIRGESPRMGPDGQPGTNGGWPVPDL